MDAFSKRLCLNKFPFLVNPIRRALKGVDLKPTQQERGLRELFYSRCKFTWA
jgi:hypothetical protein